PGDEAQAAKAEAAPGQISASGFAAEPKPTDSVKKKGFLAGFFSQKSQDAPVMSAPAPKEPKPVIKLASANPAAASLASLPTAAPSGPSSRPSGNPTGGVDLPGVRKTSLFEITRKDSLNDDSDVDLHEDEEMPMQMASAAGLARLAPNGLLKQRDNVDVSCLKPSLVRMLKQIEGHYGRKMVVTSGYRSPDYNRRVRGARKSMHMYCAAVDVQITGVSKWELARYTRSLPGRGGVGTYCHTESVHIDIGPERDWNWRCRGRKK
ncbi:MAG: YcbK family protein, partial [Mesorhizobium sp.]